MSLQPLSVGMRESGFRSVPLKRKFAGSLGRDEAPKAQDTPGPEIDPEAQRPVPQKQTWQEWAATTVEPYTQLVNDVFEVSSGSISRRALPQPLIPKIGEGAPLLPKPERTDYRKLENAELLSDWAIDQLKAGKESVGVIARSGNWLVKWQDKTRMQHSGILFFDKQEKKWQVCDLADDLSQNPPRCEVAFSDPVDFFYEQSNYDRDALLMVPEKNVRARMQKAFKNGEYKQLQFTRTYNIVTPPESPMSLNCNKWVLMNLVAAKNNDYEPKSVLERIKEHFTPSRIKVWTLIRPILKQHRSVLKSEAPLIGPINTVTVDSLYNTDLFEKKMFYSGKEV